MIDVKVSLQIKRIEIVPIKTKRKWNFTFIKLLVVEDSLLSISSRNYITIFIFQIASFIDFPTKFIN